MGRKVLLHLCALWSEGPPRQAGLRQTSCACAREQSSAPTSLPRLDKKLALILLGSVASNPQGPSAPRIEVTEPVPFQRDA